MSKRTDLESLGDIREAIQRILKYAAGMDYAHFASDSKTQDAVIRNLEILGEAAKNLSDKTRAAYADIPWQNIIRSRDRLIHHYFGVNLDIVWQIVSAELPDIAAHLSKPPKNK
jgi:uncharacterized protein with HEPN domain